MALTTIEYGSLASSAILNNNFNYLDGRITATVNSVSSLNSQISTINTNLTINKANTDLTNVTDEILVGKLSSSVLTDAGCLTTSNISSASDTVKSTIIGWGMPDMSRAVTIPSSPYTAPSDGYINFVLQSTGDDIYADVSVDNTSVWRFSRGGDFQSGKWCGCFVPVTKDAVITYSFSQVNTGSSMKSFIPCKGV